MIMIKYKALLLQIDGDDIEEILGEEQNLKKQD